MSNVALSKAIVKVLIVDDHDLVRQGIRATLATRAAFHVVGEACSGMQAVQLAHELKPDVVVMDLMMPELDGIKATRRIHAADPTIRIIVLSILVSVPMIQKVIEAGASGFISKADLASDISAAIKLVTIGQQYFSKEIRQALADQPLKRLPAGIPVSPWKLTCREHEIIQLLSRGHSSKQISSTLTLSTRTVETHRANIMRKLNLHSVTELLHFAFQNGLIEPSVEVSPVAVQR